MSSRGYVEYASGRAEVRPIARTMPTLILEDEHRVQSLFNHQKNQAAIRYLFKVGRDTCRRYLRFFPDQMAPVVRINEGERELTMMRWGMPNPLLPAKAFASAGVESLVGRESRIFWPHEIVRI
jgi:hypothetical protein